MPRIDYIRLKYGVLCASWSRAFSFFFLGSTIYGLMFRLAEWTAVSCCFAVIFSIIRVLAQDMAKNAVSDDSDEGSIL